MLINDVTMLVTNADMRKVKDTNADYCAVGLLSLDDGQKYDVTIRDADIYFHIKPMIKITVNLELTNTKYGMKLSVKELLDVGDKI